jgi:oxepin-CoA hydrolase / 3-oxo-5,6-dehydrosuberyl-CoA semialdehyde dehydrogenase
MMILESFVCGKKFTATKGLQEVKSAVTGEVIAQVSSEGLAMDEVMAYARQGGAALRKLTFHQRADILKKLALALTAKKEEFYALSTHSGATRNDSAVDIEGGLGTLFVYASKGKKDLPNETFILDGEVEMLGKTGQFGGRHIYTPLQGVALHINAFNFPVWGMLEKFAPAFLAGMAVVSKPATVTAYLAEAVAREMMTILPQGSFQFIAGSTGNIMDYLTGQDMVAFTGSADTSEKLQRHPAIARNSVRFNAERDSLNAAFLAPDAVEGTPEFDLYIKEIVREMSVKAGQKCTAIRRIITPKAQVEAVANALKTRLSALKIGHPALETTRMGSLVGLSQRTDVLNKIELLKKDATLLLGGMGDFNVEGIDLAQGAFIPPHLLLAHSDKYIHNTEAFGPVSTLIPYEDLEEGIALVQRGEGSLVASAYSYDLKTIDKIIQGFASFHGRLLFLDRDSAKESTGHGSPMPHFIHGGPGRAGGGEELGGIRAVLHHCQKTAIQGSPRVLSSVGKEWVRGAAEITKDTHPFRKTYAELEIGETFVSKTRQITVQDIEHFAAFTGDNFYAHMSEEDTQDHPFFKGRVAHGYLLLSFAAGLFVDAAKGPVLANTGLEDLNFIRPVGVDEVIRVRLTAMSKSPRAKDYGQVRWAVLIETPEGEAVASYVLLTMNAYS